MMIYDTDEHICERYIVTYIHNGTYETMRRQLRACGCGWQVEADIELSLKELVRLVEGKHAMNVV